MVRVVPARWRRAASALLVVVLVVCTGGALGVARAKPAAAHAVLDDTSPRAGAVLEVPPNEIVLDFADNVEQGLAHVQLLMADGVQVALEPPIDTPDHSQVVVPVLDPSSIGAGVYVVRYRVTAIDSHVLHGAFTFQVGTAAGNQQEVLSRVGSGPGSDVALDVSMLVLRILAFVGLALLLGSWAVALMDSPPDGDAEVDDRENAVRRALARVSWVGVALLGVASFLLFGAQAALSAGEGIGGAFKPANWGDVTDARIGMQLHIRVLLVLFALVVVAGTSLRTRRSWRTSAVVLAVCIVITFGTTGHAATGRWPALGLLLDGVHLSLAAVWIGGLVTLLVGRSLWLAGDSPVGLRFVRHAPLAVAAIVVTGVLQVWRAMPRLGALGDGGFGYALLAKTGVVVLVLILAGMGWAVVRRLGLVSTTRLLTAQVVLGVVVLGVSGALVTQDPQPTPAPTAATVSVAAPTGSLTAIVTVTPARVGSVDVHVVITDPSALQPTSDLSLTIALPDRGVEGVVVPMAPDGPDHYSAFGVQISQAGDWQLHLEITSSSGTTTALDTNVRVAG